MTQVETGNLGRDIGRRGLEEDYAHGERTRDEKQQSFLPTEGSEPAGSCGFTQNVGDTERIISAAAGAGLAAVGLMGVARGRWGGLVLGALGGSLLWRGITGRCQCYAALGINTAEHNPSTAVPAQEGYKFEKPIVINRPPSELYQFWRNLENLPRIMPHLKKVDAYDSQRSHWVAAGAMGKDVEWDAEIINERENDLIAWRSLPGGEIDTAGSVRFKPLADGSGTEMTVSLKYNPPAGKLGANIASWLGEGLEQKLDDALQRFKQVMETGQASYAAAQHSPTASVSTT